MIAGKYDKFRFEQGSTFDPILTYKNRSTGVPFDFTNYTARMRFKENIDDETPWLELDTETGGITLGGALGTISIYISADDTEAFTILKSYYTLDIINDDVEPKIYRLLKGSIILSRG
jgi:hypothetical protein